MINGRRAEKEKIHKFHFIGLHFLGARALRERERKPNLTLSLSVEGYTQHLEY
jgi:hypothetical protein